MTTTLSKEQCKNLYSWWWDSHIPKNSKWLQDNLTDMDTNVKFMIQLIEEDADSFAQRAEMFYQKRPELMKLIEEFYRAYRALAERYDHASGAIRQAHKTMSEVFPNQIPFEVSSPRSGCSTPNLYFGTPPPFDYDSTTFTTPVVGLRNEARKQLDFNEGEERSASSELLTENQNSKGQIVEELELTVKSEDELQILQRAHKKLKSEKEEALQQFQLSLSQIASLEAEIEGFQMQNSKLTIENIRLQTVDENCRLLEEEKKSMLSESEILEKKAIKQSEELSAMQEELEKLKLSLKDEHLRCLHAEASLLTLENLYSQSVEALRISELKIEMRDHQLKETEIEKKSLDEQVGRFKNEIQSLNDLNISSKNMIMEMEIEISRLKEEKKKVEAKLENHGGLKKMVEELSCLKEEIDYLRKCNRDAKKQIEVVGLNEESLQESVKELLVSNIELKDVCKKIEDGNLLLSEKVMRMEEIKEENAELEVSVSDGNIELDNLRLKIEELEESHGLLCNKNSSLESEKVTLVSMVENVKGEIEITTKKNGDLENFVSEAIVELGGLRRSLKSSVEYCNILASDKSQLEIQRNTLITQVELMGNNLEDLGRRYEELQDLYSNVEMGKEDKEIQLAELQNLHTIQRQDHELFTDFISARLIRLEEEIRRLVKEGEFRDKQYQNKQCNVFAAELEIFVIRSFLDDLKDENRNLLNELWKTEECILRQKEKEVVLLDQIERLKKVICHVWRAVNTKDDNCDVKMMITNGAEDLYERYISDKIKLLQNSIQEIEVDKKSLQKERSVFVSLLEQLRDQVTDLRTEKNDLYRDFRNKSEEVLSLQSEKERILEMNAKLVEATVVGHAREEKMKSEAENLSRCVSDLQLVYSVSQDENRKLVEENGDLSTRFCDLKEDVRLLEEEYTVILSKAMALDSLSVFFEQFENQKIEDLKILEDELNLSRKTNADLEIKAVEMMEKVGFVEDENLIFKNMVSLKLEEYRDQLTILSIDMNMVRTLNEDLSAQIQQLYQLIENRNLLLAQKESALSESNQYLQFLKNQNEYLQRNLEKVTSELGILEKKIMNKDKAIALAVQSNKILHDKMQRLEVENRNLRHLEKNLNKSFEEEFTVMCSGIQVANVHAVLFQGKVGELMKACEDLKTRNLDEREASIKELSLKDAQIREINGQLEDLAGKNQEMKSELNEYVSVISSLDENISALKDLIHSSTKFIHPSSSSDHLKVQGEEGKNPKHHHNATCGTGIVELRRVLCKVESLQEALGDSRYHMPLEKTTNLMLHPRKSTSGEMKDIPLDHVLSPNNYELVDNGQMLHLREEHDHNTEKILDAKDESKSKEYSCSEKLTEVEVENFIQDWNKEVVQRLCFDAGKLSNLQEYVFNLKTKIMDLDNAKFPTSFEFETIKVQLRDTESRILQLVETNRKLIRKARDCSRNDKEAEDDGSDMETKKRELNNKKKQVSERVGRVSDRIGRLELDLQKYQYVLLKLEEEYENYRSKAVPVEKKYSVLLKDYLYGGKRRKFRRPVTNGRNCGCI